MNLLAGAAPLQAKHHSPGVDLPVYAIRKSTDADHTRGVGVNLLHYGVVDTFGSVGATSGVHTSVPINASDSARIPSRSKSPPALREFSTKHVTRDNGDRFQQDEWPGNISPNIERAASLSNGDPPPLRGRPTPKCDRRWPVIAAPSCLGVCHERAGNGERAPPRRRCASCIGVDCAA